MVVSIYENGAFQPGPRAAAPPALAQGRACEYSVDAGVWRACAGSIIHVPRVNSRVLYFPQGHAEQGSSPVSLPSEVAATAISCLVTGVSFLADPDTEEVFVKYNLQPLKPTMQGLAIEAVNVEENENPGYISFNKVLTTSDANNGGGFSVPRQCAESIFPKLNYEDDPPLQYLDITDVYGDSWRFRHIYRGTPRRHLLTTGWSKFVNKKKLISGDTVVFVRNNHTLELSVGIRRAFFGTPDWDDISAQEGEEEGEGQCGGFSRVRRGRVQPRAVMEAVDRAVNGMPFEAVYYPRAGMAEFVVAANKVEAVRRMYWTPGIRVKMAQETDDGLRLTWHNGTIASVKSGWRMLEVVWDDDAEGLQNMKKVNPWQLEFISPTPPIAEYKGVQKCGLHTDIEGEIRIPPVSFGPMMDPLNRPHFSCNSVLTGMQGTRQMLSSSSTFTNLPEGITNPGHQGDNVNNLSQWAEVRASSDDSGSSVITFGAAATEQQSCRLNQTGVVSFRLFGETINAPLANGNGMNCTEFGDNITTEGTRLSLIG